MTIQASRESQADRAGRRLTREERKALRIADLLDCTPERRAELRAKTVATIQYLEKTRYQQLQRASYDPDAIVPTDDQHRRNMAPHILMLECLDEIDLGDRAPVRESGLTTPPLSQGNANWPPFQF